MTTSFADFLEKLKRGDGAAAVELAGRFGHQLRSLARRNINAALRHKVDPEDVVQLAYMNFFYRFGAGQLHASNWNCLWGLLTLITLRKCAEQVAYHRAERRDATREVPTQWAGRTGVQLKNNGREPAPHEAAVLSETVDLLFALLDDTERPILELSLQGYTTQEISKRLGRAERTVRLLREGIRYRLERMHRQSI